MFHNYYVDHYLTNLDMINLYKFYFFYIGIIYFEI